MENKMQNKKTSYLITLLFLIIGITNSQTLTVRYLDGDEPGIGGELYGQWELIDSDNNSQVYDAGASVDVIPYENYTIIVSEGASTEPDISDDRWFLFYNRVQTDIDLSNPYNNEGVDDDVIDVNYYHKVQVEFTVTDNIDSVFIDDPWDRDSGGDLIEGFIPLNPWLENNDAQVFPGRGGIDIEDPEDPYYQLKAKRLVAVTSQMLWDKKS
jgi:hypothetical protein|tara:strand:- start:10 stop:645 length:636 start_codon:yes stop_codon:yes gene_type:complete